LLCCTEQSQNKILLCCAEQSQNKFVCSLNGFLWFNFIWWDKLISHAELTPWKFAFSKFHTCPVATWHRTTILLRCGYQPPNYVSLLRKL
jgi:hypothetical protein